MSAAAIEVMMLCEWPSLNGGEHSMLAVLDLLSGHGVRFAVAAPPAGPLAEALQQRGIEVLPFDWRTPDGKRLPQAVLRGRLGRLLAARRPSLLHANSLSAAVMAGPVASGAGVPGIGHLRDIIKLSRQAINDLCRLDRLIAVSQATRQFHVAQGVSAEKTMVIHNGVDLDRFRPQPRRGRLHAELGLPKEAALLGAIGQLGMRKGWEVILQAMALCRADGRPIHLAAVGEHHSHKAEADLYVAQLRRFAAERLPGRVHFLGRRNDVAELLPELTLLVHAARQEPLGRVLLEGAAAGCAIVATDVGGTREIFPPETGTACLMPADDPAAMAAAIDRLIARPAERRALGAAARARAERCFDRCRTAQEIVAEYRRLLG